MSADGEDGQSRGLLTRAGKIVEGLLARNSAVGPLILALMVAVTIGILGHTLGIDEFKYIGIGFTAVALGVWIIMELYYLWRRRRADIAGANDR